MRRRSILLILLLLLLRSIDGRVRRTVPIGEDSVVSNNAAEDGLFCGTPAFVGEWETLPSYPLFVGEGQGGMILNDLVVMGGFHSGLETAALDMYAFRTTGDNTTSWRRMDDFPLAQGVTHAAFVIYESKMFVCGGYGGGHPGPAVDDCFVYDHSTLPGGTKSQWTRLPSLPEPRAGGGMTYDPRYEVLVFAGGATRPVADVITDQAVDHDTTWLLAPGTPEYGWQEQAAFPLLGNHLSSVTAVDKDGIDHHMYLGGQIGEQENTGNLDDLYEYDPLSDVWSARQAMPLARGHASSSTLPYGCGFLVAGGAVNGDGARAKTDDISYYDLATDTWTHLGSMYMEIKTPICGIRANYLYCTSGYTRQSHRRKLGQLVPTGR